MAAKLLNPSTSPGAKAGLSQATTIGRSSSTRDNLNTPSTAPKDSGGPKKLTSKNVGAAGKSSPGSAVGTTGSTQPATLGTPAPSPSWTPDQQQAFSNAFNTYSSGTTQDMLSLGQAGNPNNDIADAQAHPTGAYGATLMNDAAQQKQDTATTQAQAAARGFFNSSIKDGALNSIDATKLNNDNAALLQLGALSTSINADLARLNANWGAAQTAHVGEGAANAIAADPGTTTPNPADQSYTQPASAAAPAVHAQGIMNAGNAINPDQNSVGAGLQSAGDATKNKAVAQKITRTKAQSAKPKPGLLGSAGQAYGQLR